MFSLFFKKPTPVTTPEPPKQPTADIRLRDCKINGVFTKLLGFVLTPGQAVIKSAEPLDLEGDNLIAVESNQGHFRWRANLLWSHGSNEIRSDKPMLWEYGLKLERI